MNINEIEILKTLSTDRDLSSNLELSYTNIQTSTKISPRYVTQYLEGLKKKKYIKESGRPQWKRGKKLLYSITALGRESLEQALIYKRTSEPPSATTEFMVRNRIVETLGKQGYQGYMKIQAALNSSSTGKLPVTLFLWTDLGKGQKTKDVLNYMNKESALEIVTTHFIAELKRANMNAKNARYDWDTDTEPFQFQQLIKQEKAALDTDAMFLVHFNGKKIVEETDWDKKLKACEEGDASLRERWERLKEAISIPGVEQQNWIRAKTIEKIRATELSYLPSFLANSLEMDLSEIKEVIYNEWTTLNNPSKIFENFVEKLTTKICTSVKHDEQGPQISILSEKIIQRTRGEVRKALDEMLKEGIMEIVPMYLFKLNKEKAKAAHQKAKAAHPEYKDIFTDLITSVFR